MRYIALIENVPDVARVMIVEIEHNAALLLEFSCEFDGGAKGDDWFASVSEAVACVVDDYGDSVTNWFVADDKQIHCQQDWIIPARVPGRETGSPNFGRLEIMVDNEWVVFNPDDPPRIEIDYNSMTRLDSPPFDA